MASEQEAILANNYLQSLFRFDFKPSSISDKDLLKKRIYELLTPEWLRFKSVDEGIKSSLIKNISESVDKGEPIKVLNACGGFKIYRIDTAPHIDYSEVFHVSFFSHVLQRICEIYEPGVHLEYSGDAQMSCFVDNLKREWVDSYLSEFNTLIDSFNKFVPNNLKLTHKHFLDFYDYDVATKEVDELVKKEDINDPKNQELINKYLNRAKSNFCLDGMIDLTKKSEKEKEEIVKLSVIRAYKWYDYDFGKRGDYFMSQTVAVCNLHEFPDTYCVRSVRHQPAPPFWQGKGVLGKRNENFESIILHADDYVKQKQNLGMVKVNKPVIESPSLSEIGILLNQA